MRVANLAIGAEHENTSSVKQEWSVGLLEPSDMICEEIFLLFSFLSARPSLSFYLTLYSTYSFNVTWYFIKYCDGLHVLN